MSVNPNSAKKFYVGEFAHAKYVEFTLTQLCKAIVKNIMEFKDLERETTQAKARVEYILCSEEIAQRIAFSIVTANKTAPYETMIGIVATAITKKNRDKEFVLDALLVASEYILFSSNMMTKTQNQLFKFRKTINGKLILTNLYKQDQLGEKTLYPLPTPGPTTIHKTLGDYKWESTYTAGVDKLNKTAFTVLQIDETEPEMYDSDMDKASDIKSEQWNKWNIRKQIVPQFKGRIFYFNWHQDYRSRMYAGGYHLNPQGNNHEKNILAFADYQNITYKGKQKVKHAVARAFGEWIDYRRILEINAEKSLVESYDELSDDEKSEIYEILDEELKSIHESAIKLDKLTNDKKLRWFERNRDLLLNPEIAQHAENPTEFKAQMMSINLIETTGMTNIPVEIDGTCSQLQVVSVLTGCLKTALSCNVISDNMEIADAYKMLAEIMSNLLDLTFNRNQIKSALMIDGYGAGRKLVTETLKESLKDYYSEEAVEAFYEAQAKMSPTVQGLKDTFQSIWDEKRERYTWTLPNGFVVDYRPTDSYTVKIKPFGKMEVSVKSTLVMNTTRSTGLGVNIIHSFDAYLCDFVIVNHPNNQIWTIHDGYKVHPNDVDVTLENYNRGLAFLTDSTALEDVIAEIIGKAVKKINKQFTGSEVMKSDYSLC